MCGSSDVITYGRASCWQPDETSSARHRKAYTSQSQWELLSEVHIVNRAECISA